MGTFRTISVTTRRGITCSVRVWGPPERDASSTPLLYLHGPTGLLTEEPMLEVLARRYEIYAPVWPGFGDESGEELIDDMLDFALHGWDLADVLCGEGGYQIPCLIGHSMGAMIAAEMACLAPMALDRLVLIDPLGLWVDAAPVPDLFAMLPFEFPQYLFHDAAAGASLLTGGLDFNDPAAIETFMVANARRLGTAGKIMFPMPSRQLRKRLYRMTTPTLMVWGEHDRLVPPDAYVSAWQEFIPQAELERIPGAGHMTPIEQGEAAAKRIQAFLG